MTQGTVLARCQDAAFSHHAGMSQRPWYRDGLRFTCTRCGNCCTGAPGNVYLDEDEVGALADRLGLDEDAFRRRYTHRVRKRGRRQLSLVEKGDYDCVFFDHQRGCTVYQDRPRQCRTWPFWRSNLQNRASWDWASENCPGMDNGELHDQSEIADCLADDGLP